MGTEVVPTPHPVLKQITRYAKWTSEGDHVLPVPALRLLGALVSMPCHDLTDAAVAAGAVKAFSDVVLDSRAPVQVRCEAAWALSNIAAGKADHAQHLVGVSGVWDAICYVVERSSHPEVCRECAWVVTNVVKRGSVILRDLDCKKVLRVTSSALQVSAESALTCALLDAVDALMHHGTELIGTKGENPLVGYAKRLGLLDQVVQLLKADSANVRQKSSCLHCAWFKSGDKENAPRDKENAPLRQVNTPVSARISSSMKLSSSILGGAGFAAGERM